MAGSDAIRVICGPTSAGKSAVAMRLARDHAVAIISADSRQIYRGFDVGTGKPSAPERTAVPHFGIDVVDPTERYSAGRWGADADRWIDDARAAGRTPLVVGGTGFYLRALFAPFFEAPPLDPDRRRRLEAWMASQPTAMLQHWCRELDPPRAHLGRAQLMRAVVVALLSGRRISDLHREHRRPARRSARYLVVDPGPSLRARIERRVVEMFLGGWVEETHALMRSVPENAPAWNATGYETVRRMARGELGLAEGMRLVTIETRQFAKRQRTWLRHQLAGYRVTRVDPYAPDFDARVDAWWHEGEAA